MDIATLKKILDEYKKSVTTVEQATEKLNSLNRCLRRLHEKRPSSLEELRDDIDRQDIIAINLERAVQLCVDIASILLADSEGPPPQTMGESFRRLAESNIISQDGAKKLIKAVGFRNLSVHAYAKIDWEIVYELLDNDIEDLRSFGRAITVYLEANP